MNACTVEVNVANFEQGVFGATEPVLVDSWAGRTDACKAVARDIDALVASAVVDQANGGSTGDLKPRHASAGLKVRVLHIDMLEADDTEAQPVPIRVIQGNGGALRTR